MFWSRFARLVRALYFVRVSLIVFAAQPLLGILAARPLKSFLESLFDLHDNGFLGLVSVACFATLTGAVAVTTLNLTLWYGRRRFRLAFGDLNPHKFGILVFLTGLASATWLYIVVCLLTPLPLATTAGAGVLGFSIAAALVMGAKYLQLFLTDPLTTSVPPPYLVFPVYLIPGINRFFNGVYLRKPGRGAQKLKGWVGWIFQPPIWLLSKAGPGYVIPECAAPPRLYSGHVFSISLAIISFVVYYVIGLLKQFHVEPVAVPSLSYVLLAIMVFCWAFSALAFYLDRYRFPVLLAFFLLTQITSSVPASDHYFRVKKRAAGAPYASAAEVLKHYSDHRVPVLVAAAGGGIQAAAWEAEVLKHIAGQCAKTKSCDLSRSLALISGVSGGSIGAIQIGAAYPDFAEAARNAARPSLDDVAWGWVNPDIWRAILPWHWFRDPVVDRGWALEKAQEKIGGDRLLEKTMSEWAMQTPAVLPALLLNSTTVENGAPLVFSTCLFRKPNQGNVHATPAMSFDDRYDRQFDIRVATAARMSASFPYVTPAARADTASPGQSWHIVDGGYYDNYGLFTMMDWLTDALESSAVEDLPAKIVIVRITAFPDDPDPVLTNHGWGLQLNAPLDSFLHVRTDAQAVESEGQLKIFESYWKTDRNPKQKSVAIEDILVQYPNGLKDACAIPPLTWKLTEAQKTCVSETAWGDTGLQKTIAGVANAFSTFPGAELHPGK